MKTEKEKMLAGEFYDPFDPALCLARQRARDLCHSLNTSREEEQAQRTRIFSDLVGAESDALIQPPFFCDYGTNIIVGKKVFFNFNCVVLDVMQVRIGDHVLFGPNVQIYTAMHPMDPYQRRQGIEFARPVDIGPDVWIGGSAVICPGVSIGARSVIGAGSVVTRDIPADVFAGGNPCRVIRSLISSQSM